VPDPLLPLIVEPEQLQAELGHENLVILHITRPERCADFHIPGALFIEGMRYVRVEKPVFGMLPAEEDFSALLESLGISPTTTSSPATMKAAVGQAAFYGPWMLPATRTFPCLMVDL